MTPRRLLALGLALSLGACAGIPVRMDPASFGRAQLEHASTASMTRMVTGTTNASKTTVRSCFGVRMNEECSSI